MMLASTLLHETNGSGALLSAVLNETELLEVVRDPESPADLARDAAITIVRQAVNRKDSNDAIGRAVQLVLDSQLARGAGLADELLTYVIELCMPTEQPSARTVEGPAGRFLERADLSFKALSLVVSEEREVWDVVRIKRLAELLARRAKYFGQHSIDYRDEPSVVETLCLLEDLFADERVWLESTVPLGVPCEEGRYCLAGCVGKVLEWLYPIVSLPLINLAVDARHGTRPFERNKAGAAYLAMSKVYSDDLANRVLTSEGHETIGVLARNAALSPAMAWRIYARYTKKRQGFTAGSMLAFREDVRDVIIKTGAGTAAAGMVLQMAQMSMSESGLCVSVELARTALSGCREIGNRPVARLAPILYERLGDEAGVELLQGSSVEVALDVLHQWRKAPRAGATLTALLRDKRKSVRLRLIGQKERGPGRGSKAAHYPLGWFLWAGRPEFFRDFVLPELVGDKDAEIRELARRLIKECLEKHEGETLRAAGLKNLATCVGKCRVYDPEAVEVLIELYHGTSDGRMKKLAQAALTSLATRSGHTAEQYFCLMDLDVEGVTAAVAHAIGAMELSTCQEVIRRLNVKWPAVYNQTFFVEHRNSRVRTAVAMSSVTLNADEVSQLLRDRVPTVREALERNERWPEFSSELVLSEFTVS